MKNNIVVSSSGILRFRGKEYTCALGISGITENKTEGDGATPMGCFHLREVLYRADRVAVPETSLPKKALSPDDGWCDDPTDVRYNAPVRLPYVARAEKLWRDDAIYDVIAVIGYNDQPTVSDKGSAIFMHVAGLGYTPTRGCVALSLEDLLDMLKEVDLDTQICIRDGE